MILYKYEIKEDKYLFAPNFSFQMAEDILPANLKNFKLFFTEKEKQLMKEHLNGDDGATGLGKDSITSRFSKYNLLNFSEMFFLKELIKQKYIQLIDTLGINLDGPFYIQCWFNIIRKGEQIKKHRHTDMKNSNNFISGNICVNIENSCTFYNPPFLDDVIKVKNKDNQIVFFPSWLDHYTDEVKSDYERITIGFDITPIDSSKEGVWIKL